MLANNNISTGYYVDESGNICDVSNPPPGCHFELHKQRNFQAVWLVKESDGEVLSEAVWWPSLESMQAAGINTDLYSINSPSL